MPDFSLLVDDNKIIIEATTVPLNNEERNRLMSQSHDFGPIDTEPVKKALHRKAGQHKEVRNAGYPYIIALFPEDTAVSPEVVANAIFGNFRVYKDKDNNFTLSTNREGILFRGYDIEHTSLSGTLVFKKYWDVNKKASFILIL
ncbi:MAG: hypothetical protein MUO26_15355 [Methanotrichaceae archaeon]|nr:hypothetical protein [Methanotrichaceae archaeon]